MNQERKYLWGIDQESGRVFIEIHQKDGSITKPFFSMEELSSKEEVEERIKQIETNYQLEEIERGIEEERIARLETERLEAFGVPPKKPVTANVEDNIVSTLKERIIVQAIKTCASVDCIKKDLATAVKNVGVKLDVSKIELTSDELARIEESYKETVEE